MENAGRACAELVEEKLSGVDKPRVCMFCGTGNNGGDGFVIARHLQNNGIEVSIVLLGERSKVRGDAKANLDILDGLGYAVEDLNLKASDDIEQKVRALGSGVAMVVDAIFGTGLHGQLREEYKKLIHAINSLGCPVLAVDIPSGLDCDTGRPLDCAVKADCTVTFAAVKKGFTHASAREFTGAVYVASIGVEPGSYKR
jgi:NAD(P)H-hydrate epimerase